MLQKRRDVGHRVAVVVLAGCLGRVMSLFVSAAMSLSVSAAFRMVSSLLFVSHEVFFGFRTPMRRAGWGRPIIDLLGVVCLFVVFSIAEYFLCITKRAYRYASCSLEHVRFVLYHVIRDHMVDVFAQRNGQ